MNSDDGVRLAVFLLVLLLIVAWELLLPRRPLKFTRRSRWTGNLLLGALNQALLRLFVPVLAVGVAVIAADQGWGLFNIIHVPATVAFIACLLLFDLAIYCQHLVFHKVNWLWRLHRVHHCDLDFDVTTAVRFHPVEILLSMLIKIAITLALGAPPMAVLVFEIVLNFTALFNHGNIRLPVPVDSLLRWVVVTPDMHRVHHSDVAIETNSNFGFNLPWWDRLFGTYRAQPQGGHLGMTVGLKEFPQDAPQGLLRLLQQPFE
jgi:sterol desaturase/sphingolipid hydroxylase (fatty acid hydroxylase superfamily)